MPTTDVVTGRDRHGFYRLACLDCGHEWLALEDWETCPACYQVRRGRQATSSLSVAVPAFGEGVTGAGD